MTHDTIAAVATPPGRGSVGILRLSGPDSGRIAQAIAGTPLPPARSATLRPFRDPNSEILDQGLLLYFPAPASFTGEDVVEFQTHGSPLLLDLLLQHCCHLGARPARPGEFSERAFHNQRMDLTQAEAIADLIEASTQRAARGAARSLQGEFSNQIKAILDDLVELRVHIEASLDFAEEEIDFLADQRIEQRLHRLQQALSQLRAKAQHGHLLRDGLRLVLVGRPNSGKSSLLNHLAARDTAIVTPIPGTTRDIVRESIQINGIPLQIIDTAGLRDTEDPIEQEGLRRTRREIELADQILVLTDASDDPQLHEQAILQELSDSPLPILLIRNKIDLTGDAPHREDHPSHPRLHLSITTGAGMAALHQALRTAAGEQDLEQGEFLARRRHLDALERTAQALDTANDDFTQWRNGEILAEQLRTAQQALNEITGDFSNDDLLSEIFSNFCIGK